MGYELAMKSEPEALICGHCTAVTYYLGEAPRFCPHCGAKLPDRSERIEEAS